MKLGFLELPSDERRLYIEQAAIQRIVSAVIMEKDFWVCWLLGILFESEFFLELSDYLHCSGITNRCVHLTKPLSFDDVITILSDLEHHINQVKA